jgi:hypothetical protein
LQAYSRSIDPLYYTTQFVEGFRADIKSVVIKQSPQNLDSACCLALLQDEAGGNQTREFKRCDYYASKSQHKGPLPLLSPPEATKLNVPAEDKIKGLSKSQSVEEKMAALIAF